MSFQVTATELPRRRPAFEWWWLIWVAAGACVFLCGVTLGVVSFGDSEGGTGWFAPILSPPFGGRGHVTILVVGVDDVQGKGLADTIIAAVVSPRSGEISALAIPRDSRVYMPGYATPRKINEAHSLGGLPLTIETVEMLLGFPFDYYIEISVPGIVELVDAAGGVELEVEKRMYYRDRAQGLVIDLQPGLQRLDGMQAMGYVRYRHDAQGDLGRLERQRKFVRAAGSQVLSAGKVHRFHKLAEVFVETVHTNLTVGDVLALKQVVEMVGPDGMRMATLPGRPRMMNGQSVLELDVREVQEAVDRVLWGQGVTVSVLNATGVQGLAARTAARLEEHGCSIVEVANAEEFRDTTVVIDHRGQAKRAQRVQGWLGLGAISVQPDGSSEADVTVVLGRDMLGPGA